MIKPQNHGKAVCHFSGTYCARYIYPAFNNNTILVKTHMSQCVVSLAIKTFKTSKNMLDIHVHIGSIQDTYAYLLLVFHIF